MIKAIARVLNPILRRWNCNNCGQSNPDGMINCPRCGTWKNPKQGAP